MKLSEVVLNKTAIPVALKIQDDCPHDLDDQRRPKLTSDVEINGTTFSAGSSIVVDENVMTSETDQVRLISGQIVASAASDRLVFSTVTIQAGDTFVLQKTNSKNLVSTKANFARGTLIETPHGSLAIERLEIGDEILTRDGGIQLITQFERKRYSGLELVLNALLRPVRIQAGALVGGLPGTDLFVAQQHRLLLDDWRAPYLFGEEEILVPAISLLNGTNVTIECPNTGIEYFQIGLDGQDLISANGLWAETGRPSAPEIDSISSTKTYRNDAVNTCVSGDLSSTYDGMVPALSSISQTSLAA